jgi:hypothetical protein
MSVKCAGTALGNLDPNPYLFIIGSPRSGTTLLRRILDAHSQLAIIPESPWIFEFYKKRVGLSPDGLVTKDLAARLIEHPKFQFLEISNEELSCLVETSASANYSLFISRLFEHVGRALGKRRVGNKTPIFVRQIRSLHHLWPRAKYVHLIRDGRDVSLSVLDWKRKAARMKELFATWQDDPVTTAALCWERDVARGRAAGRLLKPELYHEVRYESLVARPAEEVEKLCSFLCVRYEPDMLEFHRGHTRSEPGVSSKKAGFPITPGLRDWKTQMPPDDLERFEAAAGELLVELGYSSGCRSLPASRREAAARLRERFRCGPIARDGIPDSPAVVPVRNGCANPYLFIVGCPRSGTTLLQRLVDAHPRIAMTPETHWIPRWIQRKPGKGLTADGLVTRKFARKLVNHSRFLELELTSSEFMNLVAVNQGAPYERFISNLFDLYGHRQGKPIVGDKTPGYARDLPTLHRLWPSARFVHLIRDGRDVCLSILDWTRAKNWKSDEGAARFRTWADDPIGTAALWWEWHVRLAREAGTELGKALYHEVRYESLVANAADECRALCEFLDVNWDDSMVRAYHERAITNPGMDSKHPWLPVTIGLRDWQSQMAPGAIRRFEAIAGKLLEELGYSLAVRRLRPVEHERAARTREWFVQDAKSQGYSVPCAWQS